MGTRVIVILGFPFNDELFCWKTKIKILLSSWKADQKFSSSKYTVRLLARVQDFQMNEISRAYVRHKISITKPFSDTALQDYVVSIVTRRGYDRCKWGLSQLLHVLRTCCHMLLTAVDKLKVDLTLWLALTRELRLKPKSESPSDVLSSEKLSDSWLFYKNKKNYQSLIH